MNQKKEIWFVFPMKEAKEKALSYNEAVEEALCFGWIDSTIKHLDSLHRIQRFTPRRKGSTYSRPNIERLIKMEQQGKIHPVIRAQVIELIQQPYQFPEDIINQIKKNDDAWENYQRFPEGYKRIRIAYIDSSRKRPEEFQRRLNHFILKTQKKQMIQGFGGIQQYYI